jgi:hypothetical protein
MKTLCCSVMIAILALAAVVPVMAQYESLENGSKLRIRWQAADGLPVKVTRGHLDAMYEDYMILVNDLRKESVILKDQIIQVEYLQSTKRRHSLSGLLLGVLVGGAAGAILGESYKPKPSGNWIKDTFVAPAEKAAVTISAVFIGSVAGGVIGFVIGSGSGPEEWVVVPPVHREAPVAGAGIAAVAIPRIGVRIHF